MKYDIEEMAVDVEELDRAIGGDHYGLGTAFLWEATPQGYGYWIDQRCEKNPIDIDALKDIKRQYMHHTGKAGKLKDMHVKAGDVVRNSVSGNEYTIKERLSGVLAMWVGGEYGYFGRDVVKSKEEYTLISLADDAQPDTPKKWGEMTDAEKGALLLAAHDGKVIECLGAGRDFWIDCDPQWKCDFAYRVKPEPKRETVTMDGAEYGGVWRMSQTGFIGDHTHRITFDIIDGQPVCSTIKMERITKEESK